MKIYINIFQKCIDKLYIMIYTNLNNKQKRPSRPRHGGTNQRKVVPAYQEQR